MAREPDLAGIRQLLQPLEASGTLIRRTDEEVCCLRCLDFRLLHLSPICLLHYILAVESEAPLGLPYY